MTNNNYNIIIPTLTPTPLQLNLFVPNLSGTSNITFTFTETDSTAEQIRKFVVVFDDEPNNQYTLQSTLTGTNTIYNNLSISHTFTSTEQNPTTYTVNLTGIRTNFIFDIITITVNIYQLTLQSLSGLSIILTKVFDTDTSMNNLLIVAETKSPQQVVNMVIPRNNLQT